MSIMGEAFVELAAQSPLEKISVSDIVAASGKNRKTFYYHFKNIPGLVSWTLDQIFDDVLMRSLAMDRVHDALRYFIAVVAEHHPFIERLLASRWHNEVEATMVRGVHTYLTELLRVRFPQLSLSVADLDAALTLYSHGMVGLLLERCGRTDEAADSFARGSAGDCQPAAAVYYNDQKPHKLFYQGLSLRKLGREAEARGCFHRLVDFGEQHLHDVFHMDYFAVSLPDLQIWEDDMDKKNRIHCLYLMGLGHMGLGNLERARDYLLEAHRLDLNHQGVEVHLALVGQQLNQ